jgi:hypothetical protein
MRNFLFLVALLAPTLAQAEWVRLVSVGEGEVTVYVDPASITREGNVVGVSTLFDYATVRTLSGAPFQSATMQDEIDCAGKQSRTLAVTSHSEPMAGGHIVSTATGGYVPWTPIDPQGIFSAIFKFVCKEKELLTGVRTGQQSSGGTHQQILSGRSAGHKDKGPSRS